MCGRRLSTRVSRGLKKGTKGRKDETRQGDKDHGGCRSERAASFCLCRECHSHEVTLAMSTLLQMVVPDVPENLIGDNAYDFDRRSYRFSRRLSWVGFLSIPTMWSDEFNAVESHLCILLMLRHPSRRDGQAVI